MEDRIEALLAALEDYVARHPTRAVFEPPAAETAIAAAEAAIGIRLPESYRRFLGRFNGGFISLAGETTDPDWHVARASCVSNELFGTDSITGFYEAEQRDWQREWGWTGRWPYVPFCRSRNHDFLVFAPPARPGAEGSVLDACPEWEPEEWGLLYESFADLLAAYLDGHGRIETVAPRQRAAPSPTDAKRDAATRSCRLGSSGLKELVLCFGMEEEKRNPSAADVFTLLDRIEVSFRDRYGEGGVVSVRQYGVEGELQVGLGGDAWWVTCFREEAGALVATRRPADRVVASRAVSRNGGDAPPGEEPGSGEPKAFLMGDASPERVEVEPELLLPRQLARAVVREWFETGARSDQVAWRP